MDDIKTSKSHKNWGYDKNLKNIIKTEVMT
jgi:hypothetical protein